jgi:hypothetical protein
LLSSSGHHHGAGEQAVPVDGAPHRPLRGDRRRIGRHRQSGQAERRKVRFPGLPVGNVALRVGGEPLDHRPGEMVLGL